MGLSDNPNFPPRVTPDNSPQPEMFVSEEMWVEQDLYGRPSYHFR